MISRLRALWDAHRAVVRAWLVLAGTIAAFLLIQPLLLYVGFIHWANGVTAQALAFALWLLGAGGHAEGPLVHSELFSLEIIAECTAILPIVIFAAAVFAASATRREKTWAFALGLPALVFVNLIRLVSLVYIGQIAPKTFDTVHLLIWQPLIILFSVALWLLWMERVRVRRVRA